MSDDENRGYGRRRSAHVPTMSVSPMEEVDRKREPKSSYGGSYKIPKKPRSSGSSSRETGSSGYSRDRDRSSNRKDERSRDRNNDKGHKRRDSYEERSPLSRRDSRDSKSDGGFNKKRGGHLEEELSVAENDTSWNCLLYTSPSPRDS